MNMKPVLPIKHPSQVPQVAIDSLLSLIKEGYWELGDQLPPQRQLANQLGIGVSSLREALQTLQSMGILEIRQGEGTFITSKPHKTFQKFFDLSLNIGYLDYASLFDARLVLESGLAYFAAIRATDEQIEKLFINLELQKNAIEKKEMARVDELDISFHWLIAEMANSKFLNQIEQPLYNTLEHLLHNTHHTIDGWNRHRIVAEAIRNREPEESSRLMRKLIEHSASNVLNRNKT